ncbi:hypothetical protein PG989_006678 [Apiospora arundinis]
MAPHSIQLPLRAADQHRMCGQGFLVVIMGQVFLTAYRRVFDPATGWVDMLTNVLCTGVAHSLFFIQDWWALPPDPPCSPGIARHIWHYSTLPRTLMYFGICGRTQIVTMGLRHLLPPLLLLPLGRGSLFHLLQEIAPSRLGGNGGGFRSVLERMANTGRSLPGLALTMLGTAAGCWFVSALGAYSDRHELRLIQDPEEDERWNEWFRSKHGHRVSSGVGQLVTAVIWGVGYGTRLWVTWPS